MLRQIKNNPQALPVNEQFEFLHGNYSTLINMELNSEELQNALDSYLRRFFSPNIPWLALGGNSSKDVVGIVDWMTTIPLKKNNKYHNRVKIDLYDNNSSIARHAVCM